MCIRDLFQSNFQKKEIIIIKFYYPEIYNSTKYNGKFLSNREDVKQEINQIYKIGITFKEDFKYMYIEF